MSKSRVSVNVPVAKDPITDKGKRNKPGRLALTKDEQMETI